jgi:hypothetical protein
VRWCSVSCAYLLARAGSECCSSSASEPHSFHCIAITLQPCNTEVYIYDVCVQWSRLNTPSSACTCSRELALKGLLGSALGARSRQFIACQALRRCRRAYTLYRYQLAQWRERLICLFIASAAHAACCSCRRAGQPWLAEQGRAGGQRWALATTVSIDLQACMSLCLTCLYHDTIRGAIRGAVVPFLAWASARLSST